MRNISIFLVASAFGCAGAGYRAPEVPVPAAYDVTTPVSTARGLNTVGQPESDSARVHLSSSLGPAPFWASLGDATLTALVSEAQRANLNVRIAESRLSGARANRRLARLDLVPTITGTGSSSRLQNSLAQTPGLSGQLPAINLYDVGFDASWEVDFFGRVNRNAQAQSALVESTQHGLEDVQISVAAEVARTYFELRGAQQRLAVAQRNAANQQNIVRLTQDRLAAGRGTAFDTERAKSVLYLTLSATPGLEAEIASDRNQLAVLLGKSADALPEALLDSAPLVRLPDTLYVGSPDQLVRRRPDVLRAERLYVARSLFVGAARAEYLPRVTVGARLGYTSTTVDSLFKRGNSRLLVGPVVTFPLFDVGRVRERVEAAAAGQEEAQAQYNATVLGALAESQSALISYDRAHARLAILESAVRSSARAADLAQQRFEAGLTDFLQVLDAERTLLDAENQLALGRTAAVTALVAAYKAVGGT